MDLVPIAILGHTATKLAEPIVKMLCGILGKYWEVRAYRQAEIDATHAVANGVDVYGEQRARLIAAAPTSLQARAELAQLERIERKQENLEQVMKRVVSLLENHQGGGTPPDLEWNEAYRDGAEDASSDELRTLWANILATEYQKPGTVSKRSMKVIQNLMKEDALLFSRFLEIVCNSSYAVSTSLKQPLEFAGIMYVDILQLTSIGLLISSIVLEFTPSDKATLNDKVVYGKVLNFTNSSFLVYSKTETGKRIKIFQLSDTGIALAKVMRPNENREALKVILRTLISMGWCIAQLSTPGTDNTHSVIHEDMTAEEVDAI